MAAVLGGYTPRAIVDVMVLEVLGVSWKNDRHRSSSTHCLEVARRLDDVESVFDDRLVLIAIWNRPVTAVFEITVVDALTRKQAGSLSHLSLFDADRRQCYVLLTLNFCLFLVPTSRTK